MSNGTTSLQSIGGPLFTVGVKGELAGDPRGYDIEPTVVDGPIGHTIDVGEPVCRGTATTPGLINTVQPAVSGGKCVGLTVRRRDIVADSSGNVLFKPYDNVGILRIGYMWVLASENVTAGDNVIAVVANAGLGEAGGVTGGAADGTTRLTVPGAYWQQTVGSGAVGLVRINAATE
jgi:hypothetical protein